jgi:hypothetical protein
MPLALGTAAVVLLALLWELARTRLIEAWARYRSLRASSARPAAVVGYDPGRERRAEQRARSLLRSCVDEHDWAMYRDLGFLRAWGGLAGRAPSSELPMCGTEEGERARREPRSQAGDPAAAAGPMAAAAGPDARPPDRPASYAYLIYPHRPIVAYVPETGALLSEYCVAFPDHSRPYGSARLPASDDVLAKWMALTADERRLIADANMHLPGRQIDPDMVRRDLLRLSRWERERLSHATSDIKRAA